MAPCGPIALSLLEPYVVKFGWSNTAEEDCSVFAKSASKQACGIDPAGPHEVQVTTGRFASTPRLWTFVRQRASLNSRQFDRTKRRQAAREPTGGRSRARWTCEFQPAADQTFNQ